MYTSHIVSQSVGKVKLEFATLAAAKIFQNIKNKINKYVFHPILLSSLDRMTRVSIPCKAFCKLADDEFVEDVFPQNQEFKGVSNVWQMKV